MDPLSISAAVVSVAGTCLKVTKAISSLREKYKHAGTTLSALCAEATVICASLSQIQNLVLQRSEFISSHLGERSELLATFDIAITGCVVVFAVLDDEIQSLAVHAGSGELGWQEKARLLWKEGFMRDMLQQLRGQQHGITLLIQTLQMESLADIHGLVTQHGLMLEHIAGQTRSLRSKHPAVKAPASVLEESVHDRGSVVLTEATAATDTSFLFDDLIVNSTVYRRVLAKASRVGLNADQSADPREALEKVEEEPRSLGSPADGPASHVVSSGPGNPAEKSWQSCLSDLSAEWAQYGAIQDRIKAATADGTFAGELSAILSRIKAASDDEMLAVFSGVLELVCERSTGRLGSMSAGTPPPPPPVQAEQTPSGYLDATVSDHSRDEYGWQDDELRSDISLAMRDPDFAEELVAVYRWFSVLNDGERLAVLSKIFGADTNEEVYALIELLPAPGPRPLPDSPWRNVSDELSTKEFLANVASALADRDFTDELESIAGSWWLLLSSPEKLATASVFLALGAGEKMKTVSQMLMAARRKSAELDESGHRRDDQVVRFVRPPRPAAS